MASVSGVIEIRRDGPFYRLAVAPTDDLPQSAARPSTYASHQSAAMNAELVRKATGWPIVDHTLAGRPGR